MKEENYSVVIIDHDDNLLLERILDKELARTMDAQDCEIIVVVAKGKKESDNLLERLRPRFPELRATFVPDSARRMDSQKIAITLGVKAAQNDRVVLMDTLKQTFSSFECFANRLRHNKLMRHTETGIDFENSDESISLSKGLFLARDCFDENLAFVYGCYEKPARLKHGAWLIRIKYILSKCHLYRS